MSSKPIRKQISIFIDLRTWKALQAEAAQKAVPITEIARRLLHNGGLPKVVERHTTEGSARALH